MSREWRWAYISMLGFSRTKNPNLLIERCLGNVGQLRQMLEVRCISWQWWHSLSLWVLLRMAKISIKLSHNFETASSIRRSDDQRPTIDQLNSLHLKMPVETRQWQQSILRVNITKSISNSSNVKLNSFMEFWSPLFLVCCLHCIVSWAMTFLHEISASAVRVH